MQSFLYVSQYCYFSAVLARFDISAFAPISNHILALFALELF